MGGGALSFSGGLVVTTKITTHKTNEIPSTMAAAAPYDHRPTELRLRYYTRREEIAPTLIYAAAQFFLRLDLRRHLSN